MVYAIIHAGGKQYKVSEGEELLIERIKGEEGDTVEVGRVLLVNQDGELISNPKTLSKVKVKCTILSQTLDDKVLVFKYKPKKGYHKEQGHRQALTKVKVDKIVLPKKPESTGEEVPAKEKPVSEKAGAAKKQSKEG